MTGQKPPGQAPSSASNLELEGRILRNTGWVAVSLGAKQVGSMLALIVLARILEPNDFGLVTLAWGVLYFIEQIQETGMGSALIYRRRDVEAAAATVLIYAPFLSVLGYIVVFAVSPLAARFFHAPDLVDVLRVMGLVLLLRGLGVVPGAILERSLDFRSRTIAEVVASFVQIAVFLGLAVGGFGVWSLVIGNLASQATQTTLYWLFVPWRPSPRQWSRTVLRELVRYGRFVGGANVLTVLSNTLDNIVVGRVLGTFSVGLYNLAYRLADFPVTVVGFVVGRTMFSVYSTLQDDLDAFRHAYVRNLQRIALLSLPLSLGLAITAEPVVAALVGDKWLGAVPALQILAVYGLIKPFGAVSLEALKGLGKPHLNFLFGVTYVAVVLPALVLLTPRFELEGAATSMLIAVGVVALPALAITARQVKLSAGELARALAPCAISSALLAFTLALLLPQSQSMAPASGLALLVVAGFAAYGVATAIFARSVVVPMWLSLRASRGQSGRTA
jgi:O-antigen/teichoic acid export membrane protein